MAGEIHDPVLARTTGRACPNVREGLGDFVDGILDATRAEWTRAHLEECSECRALHAGFVTLAQELPALREVDPGPDFLSDVLMSTLPQPSLLEVFLVRVRERVSRWQRRSTQPQEMAFALTVVLVLLTSVPGAPLEGAPAQALSLVRGEAIAAEAEAPLREAWTAVQSSRPVTTLGTKREHVLEGFDRRADRAMRDFDRLGDHFVGMGRSLLQADMAEAGLWASRIGCDVESLWKGLRDPAQEPEGECGGRGAGGNAPGSEG
jgi:anti-sigma factor RsiW